MESHYPWLVTQQITFHDDENNHSTFHVKKQKRNKQQMTPRKNTLYHPLMKKAACCSRKLNVSCDRRVNYGGKTERSCDEHVHNGGKNLFETIALRLRFPDQRRLVTRQAFQNSDWLHYTCTSRFILESTRYISRKVQFDIIMHEIWPAKRLLGE